MPALTGPGARPLLALGLLGGAFVLYTESVAAGATARLDLAVARAMAAAWWPPALPAAQAFAVVGGVEVTSLVGLALLALLWRRGSLAQAAALVSLPLVQVLETVYKAVLAHAPPRAFAHPDGPSLVTMLRAGTLTLGGSYPSGHMMRTVLVYGLCAFLALRTASPGWRRRVVVPLTAALFGLMALDRVYLDLHWQSDVVGGLLLGGAALAASVAWLDRPRTVT